MHTDNERFLQALSAALQGQRVSWTEMEAPQWQALFRQAGNHRVLPLIYEAVCACPADARLMAQVRQASIRSVMIQAGKTAEFLQLYTHLRSRGLKVLVVKGLICRSLYPRPDHRVSADEDLLVPPEQFAACRAAIEEFGLKTADADSGELSYRKPDSPLHIELHRSLFPPDGTACDKLNALFADVFSRAVPLQWEGTELLTLCPTDHMLYLLCHAFRHFLYSGFGIRQVCDIVLYAHSWGRQIDWSQVRSGCRIVRAEKFADAIFGIGREQLHIATDWPGADADCGPMLADLLDAGIFGDSSMSRKHSATVTLNAAAAQQQKKPSGGLLRSVFPSAASLTGRYPWLKNRPWLLPAAWTHRIARYHRETRQTANSDAADAIRIGNQRLALLRYYGILSEK